MTATQEQTTQSTLPNPGTYTVDPIHSNVGFVARHLVATKVRGSFTEFEGTIVIGETPESSSVRAAAKASSIKTNQDQRDEHLRSSDFFEVEKYPTMTYRSTGVRADGDDFVVDGDLTLKGVTKQVPLTLELNGFGPDPYGGHFDLVTDLTIKGATKEVVFDLEFLGTGPGMAPNSTLVGFEATASIDRRDFGVNFNGAIENGSFVLGNKIDLEIEVQASKTA
jgi:polyisoprenoid-binding protein YceI